MYPERMLEYYIASATAYHRWGVDLERPSLYALHSGFAPEGRSLTHYEEITEYNRQIINFAQIASGQKLLDAGCGTGVLSYAISACFPETQIWGINLSELQLGTAQRLSHKERFQNVHFSLQDYSKVAFPPEQFDVVIFCESFSHALDKPQTLTEVLRVLRAGGKAVFSDPFLASDDVSSIQHKQAQQVTEGFHLAPLISIQEMVGLLSGSGFRNIVTMDITKNILPSAKAIAENAQARLIEGKEALPIITTSRYGCVALGELLQDGGLKYYFVRTDK